MCYFPSLFDRSSSNVSAIVGESSTDRAKLHNNYIENSSLKVLFHSDRSLCTVGSECSTLITVHALTQLTHSANRSTK